MLNPFPIQFLALLAYFILRIFVGVILVRFGIRHLHSRKKLSTVFTFRFFPYSKFAVWYLICAECILGTMFILGVYTQIAAILTVLMSIKFIVWRKRFTTPLFESRTFYILLCGCALSLFVTGAGAFAIDLPL